MSDDSQVTLTGTASSTITSSASPAVSLVTGLMSWATSQETAAIDTVGRPTELSSRDLIKLLIESVDADLARGTNTAAKEDPSALTDHSKLWSSCWDSGEEYSNETIEAIERYVDRHRAYRNGSPKPRPTKSECGSLMFKGREWDFEWNNYQLCLKWGSEID